MLELKDVSVSYGERPALTQISFTIRPGEFVGLLGPNGSGKSSLVGVVGGRLDPSPGRVLLAGQASLRGKELARQVGVLAQEVLPPDFPFTVREVVAMGRYPHLGFWQQPGAADELAVSQAIDQVGLAELAQRPFSQLSGGERQRVLLGQVLAQGAPLLVLDEPSNHLDLRYQLELFELLTKLNRQGLTILAVLHDLNLAALYCQRLLVLSKGRLVADGSPEAVLTPALVRTVYGAEVFVTPHPQGGSPQIWPKRQ